MASLKDWKPTKAKRQTIPMSLLNKNGTQVRRAVYEDTVDAYQEVLESGGELPPIQVVWDGETAWLADGFHRTEARQRLKQKEIEAEIVNGTKRDAILIALDSNLKHGLPMSNSDKRKAVTMLLDDEEWRGWSDREIAKRVGCSHPTVKAIRNERQTLENSSRVVDRKFVTKTGKVATINTEKINEGRKPVKQELEQDNWPLDLPPSRPVPTKSSKPEFHHSFDHLVLCYEAGMKLIGKFDLIEDLELPAPFLESMELYRFAHTEAFNAARS